MDPGRCLDGMGKSEALQPPGLKLRSLGRAAQTSLYGLPTLWLYTVKTARNTDTVCVGRIISGLRRKVKNLGADLDVYSC